MRPAPGSSSISRGEWLVLAAAVAAGLLASAQTPLNTDLGWMLRFGREALETGAIPRVNGWSFTEPDHPMVLHEWLACVGAAALHQVAGVAGLVVAKWLLGAAVVALVWAGVRAVTRDPMVVLVVGVAAAQLARPALVLVRAQLFSWVLLAFVVLAVVSARRGLLWACVPAFALWANLHGGWLAGLVVLGGGCVAIAIEQRLGWIERRLSTAELVAIPALSAAALLVNPYGWTLLEHTWHHATDDVRLLNAEWTPLWPPQGLPGWQLAWLVGFGIVLVSGAFLLSPRRPRLWMLLLLAVGAGLSANRNLRIAPIFLAPVVAAMLEALVARVRPSLARVEARVPAVAGALVIVCLLPLALEGASLLRLFDAADANPGKALRAMRENGLTGKVWNDFNWGGHLVFAVPAARPSIDGRNVAAYSARAVETGILFESAPDPLAVVEQSGAELVLLRDDSPALARLRTRFPLLFCADRVCLLSRLPPPAALREPPPEFTAADLYEVY